MSTSMTAGYLNFFMVPVSHLALGSAPPYDLYLPQQDNRAPILFFRKGTVFTADNRHELDRKKIKKLYIRQDNQEMYRQNVEANLSSILADKMIPMAERSEILYDSAQFLVRSMLEDPSHPDIRTRSGRMVENTVQFMFRESKAFYHLMQVTSYDYYTYTHSVNAFVFSAALAQRLGHSEAEMYALGQGALLHDIGKSRLSPDTLNCKGKLNDEQWKEMKMHPVFGHTILKEQGVTDSVVLDITLHHHEKLHGKGYPDGLSNGQVSHWARITAIADIFDALTTRRPYKEALTSYSSLRLMRDEMAGELDASLFQTFVGLMAQPEN